MRMSDIDWDRVRRAVQSARAFEIDLDKVEKVFRSGFTVEEARRAFERLGASGFVVDARTAGLIRRAFARDPSWFERARRTVVPVWCQKARQR